MARRTPTGSQSPARARWALLALSLWLIGVDVTPCLHLMFHEVLAAHEHGPPWAGSASARPPREHAHDAKRHIHGIARLRTKRPSHTALAHHHGADPHRAGETAEGQANRPQLYDSRDGVGSQRIPAHAELSPGQEAPNREPRSAHSAGSLAHRQLAVLAPAPATPAVPEAPLIACGAPDAVWATPARTAHYVAPIRGPPPLG